MNNYLGNKQEIIKSINALMLGQDLNNAKNYLTEVVVRYIQYFMKFTLINFKIRKIQQIFNYFKKFCLNLMKIID